MLGTRRACRGGTGSQHRPRQSGQQFETATRNGSAPCWGPRHASGSRYRWARVAHASVDWHVARGSNHLRRGRQLLLSQCKRQRPMSIVYLFLTMPNPYQTTRATRAGSRCISQRAAPQAGRFFLEFHQATLSRLDRSGVDVRTEEALTFEDRDDCCRASPKKRADDQLTRL